MMIILSSYLYTDTWNLPLSRAINYVNFMTNVNSVLCRARACRGRNILYRSFSAASTIMYARFTRFYDLKRSSSLDVRRIVYSVMVFCARGFRLPLCDVMGLRHVLWGVTLWALKIKKKQCRVEDLDLSKDDDNCTSECLCMARVVRHIAK